MEKTTFGIEAEKCHYQLEGFGKVFKSTLDASDSKDLFDQNPIQNAGGYESIAVEFVNDCASKIENKGHKDMAFKEAVANEIMNILSSYKTDKNSVGGLPVIKIEHGDSDNINNYPELTEAFLNACVSTIKQMEQDENIAEKHLISRLKGW
jgi:hypothetical protein